MSYLDSEIARILSEILAELKNIKREVREIELDVNMINKKHKSEVAGNE